MATNFWQEKITIGNLSFPRFIGGPLDGITDAPFRQLVRDFSKEELLYTEMRHVRSVANQRGGELALRFEEMERPLNFQFAANSTEFVQQACEKVLAKGVDLIDLNLGCPAKNVVGSGSGSALMDDLPRLIAILKEFRRVVPIPFTVKIRSGFKKQNAIEVAKVIQDCGADALAIHPRLQTQRFEGRPDYALVAQVKKAVSIPVILSGNVVNFKTAQLAYEQTGADGYLIARGIWAKPWKLKELHEHSQGRPFTVDNKTILTYALKHLDSMLAYYGSHGLYMFRKHLPFYVKGFPEASRVRKRLAVASSADEVKKGMIEFIEGAE